MKKFVLSTLLGMLFFFVSAQDESIKRLRDEAAKEAKKDAADTTTKTWKRGGIYGLNISQGSLTNWAAGGEDFSLSINSLLNLYAFYKKTKHSWDNTFDFNLGYVNTTSLGGRKNDDRFDLLSKYGYALGPKLNLAGIFNFRSQLFRGYTFEDNIKTYSSNFLAPGYLLLGAGLDYKPVKDLSIFLSPATARWIIVRDTALSNKGLYGVDPGETSALEFGAFATINYLKDISKSVTYKGRLDLFSNYLHNPQNIDVYMTNAINVKLSRVLALTWGLDLIYDDDVKLFGPNRNSAAWQIKSLVGIGLLVKFD
jgi:hypothetical protein